MTDDKKKPLVSSGLVAERQSPATGSDAGWDGIRALSAEERRALKDLCEGWAPTSDRIAWGPGQDLAPLSLPAREAIDVMTAAVPRLLARVEELEGALRRIRDYEPEHVAFRLDNDSCDDCRRNRERQWPPSGLCEKHYGLAADNRARREDVDARQHYRMRDIARAALATPKPKD